MPTGIRRDLDSPHLTVGALDGGARGSAGGLDVAEETRAHVDDGRAGGVDGGAGLGGLGVGELEGAVVGKGDERAALLKVLDDPLGVVLAELVDLGAEGVGDRVTGSQVLDGGGTGLLAGRLDGGLDRVTGGDVQGSEVDGGVGVPLVPGIVGGGGGGLGPRDTSLEDRAGCCHDLSVPPHVTIIILSN